MSTSPSFVVCFCLFSSIAFLISFALKVSSKRRSGIVTGSGIVYFTIDELAAPLKALLLIPPVDLFPVLQQEMISI